MHDHAMHPDNTRDGRLPADYLAMMDRARAVQLTPPECSHELAAGMRRAELHILPGCGHLLTWERPQAVNALLRGWMAAQGWWPAVPTQ